MAFIRSSKKSPSQETGCSLVISGEVETACHLKYFSATFPVLFYYTLYCLIEIRLVLNWGDASRVMELQACTNNCIFIF